MNALLLYPDRPYGLGTLYGYKTDQETGLREKFVISEPADLDKDYVYAKERRLAAARLGRRLLLLRRDPRCDSAARLGSGGMPTSGLPSSGFENGAIARRSARVRYMCGGAVLLWVLDVLYSVVGGRHPAAVHRCSDVRVFGDPRVTRW